jgi:hypothetical protein
MTPRTKWTYVSTRFFDDLGSVDVHSTVVDGVVIARTRRYNDRTFIYSVDGAAYLVITEAEAFAMARGLDDVDFSMLSLPTASGSQVARDAARSDRSDARRLGVMGGV